MGKINFAVFFFEYFCAVGFACGFIIENAFPRKAR